MEKIKNFFRSISYPSLGKRGIILIIGILLSNFGIACYYKCLLGTDPYSVMIDSMHTLFNLSHGQITNILNIVLFVLMLIFGRKYINLGTVVSALAAGTLIDLFERLVDVIMPEPVLWMQIVILAIGFFTFAAGIGLVVTASLGLGVAEFIPVLISEKSGINLRWIRIGYDVFCLLTGVVLGLIASRRIFGDLVGVGTILGAFGTGVVMKFIINRLGGPLGKWFGPLKKEQAA